MPDDDWYTEAAELAAAKIARRYHPGAVVKGIATVPDPAAAKEAAAVFAAVASGKIPPLGAGVSGRIVPGGGLVGAKASQFKDPGYQRPEVVKITPEIALATIIETVRSSKDPFSEVGVWITKVTNALTGVLKELDDPE